MNLYQLIEFIENSDDIILEIERLEDGARFVYKKNKGILYSGWKGKYIVITDINLRSKWKIIKKEPN